jgi:hypothetical protein
MKMVGSAYPENPVYREFALSEIRKQIELWPDVSSEFKALAMNDATRFMSKKIRKLPKNARAYGGALGTTSIVIKNDELNLLGQLGPAAISIVSYLAVPTAPIVVLAFGLAITMLGIAKQLKTKSVVIDPEDYYFLMTLKQAGPSTVSELSEALGGIHIFGNALWDDTRTLANLNKLKQVRQIDGSNTALVNEASDGRWSTSGI